MRQHLHPHRSSHPKAIDATCTDSIGFKLALAANAVIWAWVLMSVIRGGM